MSDEIDLDMTDDQLDERISQLWKEISHHEGEMNQAEREVSALEDERERRQKASA